VVFGSNTGSKITADSYRLSLQHGKCTVNIAKIPTKMQMEAAAGISNNVAYVCGIGESCKETWRWDATVDGWARCGDMIEGRRRHCATFVNNTSMYALGGYVDSTKTTLSSVEEFDTVKNKWTTVGKLVQAVNSAGCVSHKTSVYVFGGTGTDANKDVDLDFIQVFDTITKQCSVLTQRLPCPERVLRAVLWDKSVILMNHRTCLIFDLEHHSIQQRDQFAPGILEFGFVLNNQTLFVIGGGTSKKKLFWNTSWTCSDEVKCLPVTDVISNQQTVMWTQHSKLTSLHFIQAHSLMTIALKFYSVQPTN
jgi:Kelch motif